MEIFIDEAGSFVAKGASKNSWCIVAAFVCLRKSKYRAALENLKRRAGKNIKSEIKINEVSEENYKLFLEELYKAGGILGCLATESGFNKDNVIKKHQEKQAALILNTSKEMKYKTGRDGVKQLVDQITGLSYQLYIQLFCQIYLMNFFVKYIIPYIVQRTPQALKKFAWKIDQKAPDNKTDFEDAFEKISPLMLQTISINEPGIGIIGCDYSYMEDYMYKAGELPEYIAEKFPAFNETAGLNIQKIIRDDISFIDSKDCEGIQIVDLLASGLRRVLRQQFQNNEYIAHHLGKLMVQPEKDKAALEVITFNETGDIDPIPIKLIQIMTKACRPMIFKNIDR